MVRSLTNEVRGAKQVTQDEYLGKCTAIPIAKACHPPTRGIFSIVSEHWWLTTKADGLLFFKGSPQCNIEKTIAERLASRYPDVHVLYIPLVFVPLIVYEFAYKGGVPIVNQEKSQ
jgi:hypothetical protein